MHVVVWVVLFIIPAYLIYGDSEREKFFLREVWIQEFFYGLVFYTSYLWLAPRLFFRENRLRFFLYSGALILMLTLTIGMINRFLEPGFRDREKFLNTMPQRVQPDRPDIRPVPPPREHPPGPLRGWPLFNFLFTSCLISGLSLGLRFSEKLNLNEKQRKEAEKEKLHTELAFLKHKINPHFLFNTLNSIYGLALIKSDQTAEAVMKLSDMMRYVIQDVEHEKVPLEREIDYVQHYVELQKIRLSGNVEVRLELRGSSDPYEIPPMILVPFVENAFKYGTSSHEATVITISILIDQGKLAFEVTNRVFAGREKTETFGIGIENTRQRLSLMYPDKHTLLLRNDGTTFNVSLTMLLS